mmetsp:Transcript_54278/g.128190  ORF Transcript_54278/g.128190 Transcript_54278/m.128190 type:complete len:201 (+) Transcript_54278:686-1288(+)
MAQSQAQVQARQEESQEGHQEVRQQGQALRQEGCEEDCRRGQEVPGQSQLGRLQLGHGPGARQGQQARVVGHVGGRPNTLEGVRRQKILRQGQRPQRPLSQESRSNRNRRNRKGLLQRSDVYVEHGGVLPPRCGRKQALPQPSSSVHQAAGSGHVPAPGQVRAAQQTTHAARLLVVSQGDGTSVRRSTHKGSQEAGHTRV